MSRILTSWKDIAAYLGKGVRTVQRWEREMGLPVRRPQNGAKHAVIAVRDELDLWVQRQQTNHASVEELHSKMASLREMATKVRSDLVLSGLSLALTFCQMAEIESAFNHVDVAAKLIQKASKMAEDTQLYLDRPHRIDVERLFDIERQLAQVELRVGALKEQLSV